MAGAEDLGWSPYIVYSSDKQNQDSKLGGQKAQNDVLKYKAPELKLPLWIEISWAFLESRVSGEENM